MSLRALVVGSGWGSHAARTFRADSRTELCALVGRNSARTRQLAAELAVPAFDGLEQAIATVRPQLASVAVHEGANPQLVRTLLGAGCHVLCSHPVARAPEETAALAALAAEKKLLLATDYTLRRAPGFLAVLERAPREGHLLRLTLETPASTSVIGLDLALALAGPVRAVDAWSSYPGEVAERARQHPRAFGPTFVLEHQSGCVTTLTPVPHADPASAYRVVLSFERCRVELLLPAGECTLLRYLGKGRVERTVLQSGAPPSPPVELYGGAMRALVNRFIGSVFEGLPVDCDFFTEAHVAAVSRALEIAARTRARTEPQPLEPSAAKQPFAHTRR